jgi:hypothetical protein
MTNLGGFAQFLPNDFPLVVLVILDGLHQGGTLVARVSRSLLP